MRDLSCAGEIGQAREHGGGGEAEVCFEFACQADAVLPGHDRHAFVERECVPKADHLGRTGDFDGDRVGRADKAKALFGQGNMPLQHAEDFGHGGAFGAAEVVDLADGLGAAEGFKHCAGDIIGGDGCEDGVFETSEAGDGGATGVALEIGDKKVGKGASGDPASSHIEKAASGAEDHGRAEDGPAEAASAEVGFGFELAATVGAFAFVVDAEGGDLDEACDAEFFAGIDEAAGREDMGASEGLSAWGFADDADGVDAGGTPAEEAVAIGRG